MDLWIRIYEQVKAGKKCCLLLIIESIGSSPGRQGFKMLVQEDGDIFGSIGGGVMEHAIVEEARGLLMQATLPKHYIKRQVHQGRGPDGSGMICSGEQTVLFLPLDQLAEAKIDLILQVFRLKTSYALSIDPATFGLSDGLHVRGKYKHKIKSSQDWYYFEKLAHKDRLYVVGSGHVGLACTKLFSQLDFEVTVLDNRPELNTFLQNKFADKRAIVDYQSITDHIPEDGSSYVAIMTHGFKDDRIVLQQLLGRKYAYLGVLGSRRKLEIMFTAMAKAGYDPALLEAVHGPIGMSIRSQTPMEIAVSIAAEIIAVRNADKA